MTKLDLRRSLDGYRAPRDDFRVLDLPPTRYLALDGRGDPNADPAFADAPQALYPAAYAVKFASKAAGQDYVVPPLEALWWSEDMAAFTTARDKARWSWTLLLLVPDAVGDDLVEQALPLAAAKARSPRSADVRVLTLEERLCVQTLHVGAFDDEAEVLRRLHEELVPAQGLRLTGRHHEVYLSDVRRTPPERRRTILRQPVVPARDEEEQHG